MDGTANSTTVINSGNGVAAGAIRVSIASDSTGQVDVTDRALRDNGKIDIAAFDVALPAGTNNIGDIDVLTVPAPLNIVGGGVEAAALRVTLASDSTGVLSIDDNGGALTVDGTITANAGTDLNTSSLNLEATQASVKTAVELIDDSVATLGTTTYLEATTKGLIASAVRRDADTSAVNTDNEAAPLLVDARGALKVEAFSGETLPVSLTSTTITGTVAVTQSGTWDEVGINDSGNNISVDWAGTVPPIGAGTEAAALRVTVATDSTGVLSVDDNGGALTVDNGGTFATQATLQTGDNAVGRVKLTDGTDVADILDLATSNPLTVAIVDGTGAQITSFGGGTQYTEGDTDASITGTAVMWEDVADTLRVASAAKPLPVEVIAGATSGTEYVDDTSTHSTGVTSGFVFMAAATPTDGSVDANDLGSVAMSTDRRLHTDTQIVGQDAALDVSGATVTVQATNLDIRDLTSVSDSVAVLQATASNLNATVVGTGTFAAQVTGTVTADAGTNLNTSALNLEATQASVKTSVELIDDTVATLGTTTYTEAATKGLIIGAIRRDADTTLVDTTNEVGPLQMDAAGRLKVEAFSGETLPVSLTSTTITGTVAVTQSGTWDEVGINDSGNAITVDWAGTAPPIGAGTEATALRVTVATDSTGVLSVDDNGAALTVDNGGTFAVQESGSALTALQLIDNPIAVLGTATYLEATTSGNIIGAVRRDADTSAVNTDNEIAPLLVNAIGALKVEAFSGETLPVSLTSTTITGTVAVTQSGTWDEVGINDSGNNISVDWAGTVPPIGAGTEAAALRVTVATDSTGVLSVDDNGAALTVDNAGTFAVQATAVGTVADDATTPGSPQMIGGQAKNFDGTAPGNVSAEDDVCIAIFDRNRRQYVNTIHPEMWSYHENSSSALTDTSVAGAPGANESLFVTDIVVSTGAATALNIFFEEGASTVLGPYYLEAIAGRGFAIHFNTPKKITANTALTVTTSAAIAHSIDITGFVARVD